MKKIIVTGTPGAGKTTLLTELQTLGIPYITESATQVIHQNQVRGIMEPWLSPNFIIEITHHQIQQQTTIISGPIILFDRSIFCTYALCLLLGHSIPKTLESAIHKAIYNNTFNKNVIFIENLGFIANTSARKITYTHALIFEAIHQYVYKKFGFNLIYIPKAALNSRAHQVQTILKQL